MREIKFKRAHFDFNGNFIRFTEWGKFNGLFASPASLSNEAKEMAIDLQFTGLTDKNGKDIYEGDIVTYVNRYAQIQYTHLVKWDDDWACFALFEKDNKWAKESDWVKITEIEIIGNIYQNPDLLK